MAIVRSLAKLVLVGLCQFAMQGAASEGRALQGDETPMPEQYDSEMAADYDYEATDMATTSSTDDYKDDGYYEKKDDWMISQCVTDFEIYQPGSCSERIDYSEEEYKQQLDVFRKAYYGCTKSTSEGVWVKVSCSEYDVIFERFSDDRCEEPLTTAIQPFNKPE